ncbi:MarR family winged helix-turn-helix transcriptional regulator [Cellulomonas wangsupingiae]|uniref:MarR family winged helix-turn-helix transcriptional regulator n=1 Tax=Cellulomonas wangsupingiae TaxID=2968085 RepID=A0ABY5K415_9CELL|nr:MarR family winged helix-turn-helix transcriptional regulator [Cellulomonas wangsupingiae]MCC2336406.1 MarR family winged helix-turn-helix transcriptional regulator [Cellulomonas wangsupingiae]MCM0640904.1 MarR family winged helix-turn-helix transcriptional regulator [Cellulomonas wangsupingiae]UUI64710.1 MarR family winged helix-turn-helix transcriptional regulator [Cellulomonas wangsupingiae]
MTETTTRAGDDLGWQLGTLLARWRTAVGDVLDDIPAGPRGYHLLRVVADTPTPPTQAALAGHLGIDRTVMTYLLDDLCAAELVERCPDPADRRVRRITATALGRTALADVEDRIAAAEATVLGALTADEQDALRALLARATGPAASGEDRCAVVTA